MRHTEITIESKLMEIKPKLAAASLAIGVGIVWVPYFWKPGFDFSWNLARLIEQFISIEAALLFSPLFLYLVLSSFLTSIICKTRSWLYGIIQAIPASLLFGVFNFGDGPRYQKIMIAAGPLIGAILGTLLAVYILSFLVARGRQ
jgi:hypothetical protein